jgi:hypothetical protein
MPQSTPSEVQSVSGVQVPLPQTLGVLFAPQTWLPVQSPQCTVPPHPSLTSPQSKPGVVQSSCPPGVHVVWPHVFGTLPPPQLSPGLGHVLPMPQVSRPPQPSAISPQSACWSAHVVAVGHVGPPPTPEPLPPVPVPTNDDAEFDFVPLPDPPSALPIEAVPLVKPPVPSVAVAPLPPQLATAKTTEDARQVRGQA